MFQVTWHHPYLHVYVSSTTNEKRFDPSQCGTGSSGRLESWVSKCHWPSLNPMVYHHFPIKIDMKWRLIHHFFIDKPILYCCLYCCIMLYPILAYNIFPKQSGRKIELSKSRVPQNFGCPHLTFLRFHFPRTPNRVPCGNQTWQWKWKIS